MANWAAGIYAITAGTTGTSTGGNGPTSFINLGATWPTAPSLSNFTLRILSGTGAGQERIVFSNTPTNITISTPWSVIPDNTSTYEIVLKFYNADHITGIVTVNNNIFCEIEDNATIYFDGLYYLTSATSNATWRWDKTLATMPTLESNNKTTQGVYGFFSYGVYLQSGYTGTATFRNIKIEGAAGGLLLYHSATANITAEKIWVENATTAVLSMGTSTGVSGNKTFSRFFAKNGSAARYTFPTLNTASTITYEKMWQENFEGGGYAYSGVSAPAVNTFRDSVLKRAHAPTAGNTLAGKEVRIYDNYFSTMVLGGSNILAYPSTAASAGTFRMSRNYCDLSRIAYGAPATVYSSSVYTRNNDAVYTRTSTFQSLDYQAGNYVNAVSEYDFLAGHNNACVYNVDVTANTSSSSSPQQYRNLTVARTPATSRNRPQAFDNIVSIPSYNSATITYDSVNGTPAGYGNTTVNVDSNSGQPVLNVASETGFEVGEKVEIGYGTARFEIHRILSIAVGQLTLENNLTYTHTSVQADTVKKNLRVHVLPFIRFGEVSGVYTNESALPDEGDFGLVWCEIKTIFNGVTYAWNNYGHSVTITGLRPQTTYYYKVLGIDPLGNVIVGGVEQSFLTTADPSTLYTDPGVANVRLGTTYQFNSAIVNRTGTARIPPTNQVKIGVVYDSSDSLTGTYDGSERYTDVPQGNVILGYPYAWNSLTNNRTGTLESTDPGQNLVVSGITYKINSVNKTGTFTVPTASAVASAVWEESMSSHTTSGTFGWFVKKLLTVAKFIGLK